MKQVQKSQGVQQGLATAAIAFSVLLSGCKEAKETTVPPVEPPSPREPDPVSQSDFVQSYLRGDFQAIQNGAVIQPGDVSTDVIRVQRFLSQLFPEFDLSSSSFDAETEAAVMQFQELYNLLHPDTLPADGRVGPETLEAMVEVGNRMMDLGVNRMEPLLREAYVEHHAEDLERVRDYAETLRRGTSGEDVYAAQVLLKMAAPGLGTDVDGAFGPQTAEHLTIFQRHVNNHFDFPLLPENGRLTPATLYALERVALDQPIDVVRLSLLRHVQPERPASPSRVASQSYYNEPIRASDGPLVGYSRDWGGAKTEVQCRVMAAALEHCADLPVDDQAAFLAILAFESGFNPSAANPFSSAASCPQFIDSTGEAHGVTDDTRFEINTVMRAYRSHFDEMKRRCAVAGERGCESLYTLHYAGSFNSRYTAQGRQHAEQVNNQHYSEMERTLSFLWERGYLERPNSAVAHGESELREAG